MTTAIYGALAAFYFLTVLVTFYYLNTSLLLLDVLNIHHWYSILARLIGGVMCIIILMSFYKLCLNIKIGQYLTWILACGVFVINIIDNLNPVSPIAIWFIISISFLVHSLGIYYFKKGCT